ncbi:MAG: hypothetical protein RR290_02330, partial [Clostridia bacterium]
LIVIKFKIKIIIIGIITMFISVFFISNKNIELSILAIIIFAIYIYYQKYIIYKNEMKLTKEILEREKENNKNLKIIAEEIKKKNK